MLRPRIIPCLLVHEGSLVKTRGFAEPTYVGDPINAVRIFNEKAVDELIVLDIDATAAGTEINYALIASLAAECRMPLCYGGGVSDAHQVERLVALGVEKVAISAAAIADPDLIRRAGDGVGRQSIVVVLDVRRTPAGYRLCTHNGQRMTALEPAEFARQCEALGVGEIVINSIDRDGLMDGYDRELVSAIASAVDVPVTMLGGAGSLDDIGELFASEGTIGAAAGSLFVFKGALRAVLINYPNKVRKNALFERYCGRTSLAGD